MDDRTWEKLRRRARREKIWSRLLWTIAGLDTPFACWAMLKGQWGRALFDALTVILLVFASMFRWSRSRKLWTGISKRS